jgi:hypothetical protein
MVPPPSQVEGMYGHGIELEYVMMKLAAARVVADTARLK